MLTPAFALRQGARWEKRLGPGVNGSRFAPAAEIRCRVDGKRIFLPAHADAGPGDRICIDGSAYLLRDVKKVHDFSGRVNHLEGELT